MLVEELILELQKLNKPKLEITYYWNKDYVVDFVRIVSNPFKVENGHPDNLEIVRLS